MEVEWYRVGSWKDLEKNKGGIPRVNIHHKGSMGNHGTQHVCPSIHLEHIMNMLVSLAAT